MAFLLPSSWNEWGGTGLMHMASGLRDNVNPQGAGASGSLGQLREARWAVTSFASGRLPIRWPSMLYRLTVHTFQSLSSMVMANDSTSYAQPTFEDGILITTSQMKMLRVGKGLVQGLRADRCRPGCIPLDTLPWAF